MPAGAKFLLPIHSFSSREAPPEVFETAFAAESPFGGKVRLAGVLPPEHICLQFQAAKQPVSSLSIRFLTPTELKTNGQIASEPEFAVLFSRAYKRIQALQLLYAQPTRLEDQNLFAQAEKVTLLSHALIRAEASRVSSHTHQTHPLGGFRGEATYQGNFQELLPWLQAAQWTGIGRQTVWGKGEILVQGETEET